MNNQKFNPRAESLDFGANYEVLMAACYGLTLSFADEVNDFKLSTNNQDMDNFDDLVLEIKFSDDTEYLYAFQLKHRGSKETNMKVLSFTADKGNYGLKKYCKGFNCVKTICQQNNSSYTIPFKNFRFILYTNGFLPTFTSYDKTLRKEIEVDKLKISEDITVYRYDQCVLRNLINLSRDPKYFIYKFKSPNEELFDEDFLEQFFLYTKQKNAREIERHINQTILNMFSDCDSSVVTNYLNFFKNWWRGDFGAFKLTKKDILLKLAEYVLFPHIPEVDFRSLPPRSEKSKLLNECFSNFDLTLIENSSGDEETVWGAILYEIFNEIDKTWLWSRPLSKDQVLPIDEEEVPISTKGKNFTEQSLKKIYTISWHKNRIPMFVKVDDSCRICIYKAIQLVSSLKDQKKFIILDKKLANENFATEVHIFQNLSNLVEYNILYEKICEELEVSPQGRRCIKLKELIKIDNAFLTTISTKEIVHMIGGNFTIGDDCKKDLPKLYVDRLTPKILLSIQAVEEVKDDLFIINETDFKMEMTQSKLMILGNDSNQQFSKICSLNVDKNCHLIKIDNDERIEWIETQGSIGNLKPYQLNLKEFKNYDFVKDSEILNYFNNKINIICADPGMGKTVMLKFLKFYCPSNHWVITVHLSDHIKFFKGQHTAEEALNYFVNLETRINFIQNVVKIFASRKQILFLWDAFDELPSYCHSSAKSIIQSLAKFGYRHWIAGRNGMKEFLENTFEIFSLTITQFTKQNQWNFIYDSVKDRFPDGETEIMTHKLNESMASSLKCGYFDYSGIPLHIHMITEIFLKNPQKYLDDFKIVILTDIYQKFVEKKFEDLFERAKANKNNFLMQKIRKQFEKTFSLDYEIAALKASFDEETFSSLKINCDGLIKRIKENMDIVGIIFGINSEEKPIFTHKTYEEYLTASWLSKNCKMYPNLCQKLFEDDYKNIRLMFDMILASDNPVHIAVIYQNIPILEKYQTILTESKDKGGRNPLHIACSWGTTHPSLKIIKNTSEQILICVDENVVIPREINVEIVKFLLSQKCDPFLKDELMDWSVVAYAARSRSLASIDAILSYNFKINSSEITRFCDIQTLLYYSIRCDYSHLFHCFEDYPDIEIQMDNGEVLSLLQFAIKMNRLRFGDKLMHRIQ